MLTQPRSETDVQDRPLSCPSPNFLLQARAGIEHLTVRIVGRHPPPLGGWDKPISQTRQGKQRINHIANSGPIVVSAMQQ